MVVKESNGNLKVDVKGEMEEEEVVLIDDLEE